MTLPLASQLLMPTERKVPQLPEAWRAFWLVTKHSRGTGKKLNISFLSTIPSRELKASTTH
jgi:hypothetical protein